MKVSYIFLAILFVPVFLFPGCAGKDNKAGNIRSFEADTLRGASCEFTSVESGRVVLKPGAMDLLGEVDDTGSPKYPTETVVASFTAQKDIIAADGRGMAIRFRVPQIADNDYCLINAEITPPRPVNTGGNVLTSIPADFRYDAKTSGHTEYIWFLFSGSASNLMIPGKWTITLFNKGSKLTSADFSVLTK